jgi:hypothetical protein
MQHNIYTLEKEMLRDIERRRRDTAHLPATPPAPPTPALGQGEVLVVTRTLVRLGPLVLAWDRH